MKSAHMTCVSALCLLLLASAAPAHAEDLAATSFDQLRLLARLGDTITVTDASGRQITGRLAALTPAALSLVGDQRTFTERDITTISRHDHANLSTGAKWGLGVGAGFALLAGAVYCEYHCGAGYAVATLVYGGLGAGVGVGISALIPTRRLIFVQSRASAARLVVAPLLSRDRQGLVVSLHF